MKRILLWPFRALFYVVAGLVLLVEEFAWEPLHALAKWIGRLPLLRQLETKIAGLPPTGALFCFLAPSVILVPFKILALAAFARGMYGVGLAVAISAKVVGTALVSRIFTLCKPTLLTVPWFKRAYEWVQRFKAKLKHIVFENPVVRAMRAAGAAIRDSIKQVFARK